MIKMILEIRMNTLVSVMLKSSAKKLFGWKQNMVMIWRQRLRMAFTDNQCMILSLRIEFTDKWKCLRSKQSACSFKTIQ